MKGGGEGRRGRGVGEGRGKEEGGGEVEGTMMSKITMLEARFEFAHRVLYYVSN